jgi:hypothetical protein
VRKKEGFGYTATAAADYYGKIGKAEDADLAFTKEFDDWYYNNWQWWEDVLQPVTGVEQVKLIAEFFPELGFVCRQIWDGQEELIDAMQKAPFSKKEDIDFFDILVAVNSSEKAPTASRGIKVADSDSEFDESDYEPARPPQQTRQTNRTIDEPEDNIYDATYGKEPEAEAEQPNQQRRRFAEPEAPPARPKRTVSAEPDDDDIEVNDEAPTVRSRNIHTAVADKMKRQRPAAVAASNIGRSGRGTATVANEYDDSDYEDE